MSPAASGNAAGDLLLLFGEGREPPGRSPGRWLLAERDASWRLLLQPPSEGWKGFPLRTAGDARWQLWLLGESYGSRSSDPTSLLEVSPGELGTTTAAGWNGHFLLLGWQRAERRWHVWTDRFGTLHGYHCGSGPRAALGTFSPAVAAAASSRNLDWPALTGFFALGFFPGNRTHFDDVRILRPATHSVISDTGRLLESERYWQWSHRPDPGLGTDEAAEELARLLGLVMAEETRTGRIALPVSGGLDSRTAVAGLKASARGADRIWSFSYGYSEDSPETEIAGQVARAAGLPFDSFTIGEYLSQRLDSIVSSVEGFQDVTQCRQAAVTDEIGRRADFVIAAHWGDVWLDDAGLGPRPDAPLSEEDLLTQAFAKMAKRGRRWLLRHIAEPRLSGEDSEEIVRDFLREEMARLPPIEDPDFRLKALKTDLWSFRWTTTSLRMYQPGAFPRLPFYDTRLTDFFLRVPSALLPGRSLQIEYLKRFAPDLARIVWQKSGTDLFHPHRRATLAARVLGRARRILTGRRILERNWEVQLLGTTGRRLLEEWLLAPGRLLHELVPVPEIRKLVSDFLARPGPEAGYTVSMALTFSAWLERYR